MSMKDQVWCGNARHPFSSRVALRQLYSMGNEARNEAV